MNLDLKKIHDQVIVITGASSGIGLVTAREAARRGARLVVAARTGDALHELVDEIRGMGTDATAVTADVGNEGDVRRIAEEAKQRFGGFDSWVNNAGVSIYGKILDIPLEDMRKLFDTDFWGVVNGSRVACWHLRHRGGVIVNIGSTVSDRAIPLQGIYSASKHAVKGFTDALRMELEEEGAPIAVSLIKPGSIDTPFTEHAKNYMEKEPVLPPPVYAPDLVADAILHCCETGEREMYVGAGGMLIGAMGKYAPSLTDKVMEKALFRGQKTEMERGAHIGLERASGNLRERGGHPGMVRETSLYTQAVMHPWLAAGLFAAAGMAFSRAMKTARH